MSRGAKKTRRTKRPRSLLIRGAHLITLDPQGRIGRSDLLVENGRISKIDRPLKATGVDQVIEAKGLVAMPGLVQAHVHLAHSLFRGLAENMAQFQWLHARLWPLEAVCTANDIRAAARLGMAELLLGGTTAVLDFGPVQHADLLFREAERIGIRYTGGKTILDRGQGRPAGFRETADEAISQSVRLCEAWHGKAGGRLRYAFSPYHVLYCSEAVLRRCRQEAKARRVLVQIHAAQTAEQIQLLREQVQMGNVSYLHSLELCASDVLLADCVWVSLEERKILRQHRPWVVHCPSANLKLGSGTARIAEFLNEGIQVALGADSPASNNRLDAFTELRTAALLHNTRGGVGAIPAPIALRMATRDGARALGLEDVGTLAVGQWADIILLDLHKPHAYPPGGDLISRVVFAAQSSDVHTVIVAGKIVVDQGELVTGEQDKILAAAKRAGTAVANKVG